MFRIDFQMILNQHEYNLEFGKLNKPSYYNPKMRPELTNYCQWERDSVTHTC